MTIGRKQANGMYPVRVQVAGRDVRRQAPSRELAKALDAKLKAQRFSTRNGLAQDQPRMLFANFYAEWWTRFEHGSAGAKKPRARTLESVADVRKRLAPLDNLWCDGITRERLEQLAAGIAGEGHQDRAHKALHLARRVLRDAAERGVRVDERVFKARIAPATRRELRPRTWPEVMAVYSWLPDHVCRAAPFLALTGLRVSEFCALLDSDFEDGSLLVRRDTTKTDAGARRVYLCAEAARIVREQRLARPVGTDRLFPNQNGRPYNRRSFHAVLARAGGHAGVDKLRPHDLRATCATLSAQAGVPFEIVKEQLGWSDATAARMWPIYRKVANWETPKAVRLLDAVVENKEQQSLVATAARCPVKSEEAEA